MRATAIRCNFREFRFLFTCGSSPGNCAHVCVSVQGFTPVVLSSLGLRRGASKILIVNSFHMLAIQHSAVNILQIR
jgi:hypothetical protein